MSESDQQIGNHTASATASATGSAGVRIENLSLAFGETEVLKGIDLTIAAGEFFAFLGPSGSGKSTLLRAIAGFGPTPRGRILIGDEDVGALPPWKRNVGMVFQSYALWPHMTVAKNVAFGLEERKLPRAEINKRTMEALDLVGLADYANRRPSQLSGGQQQRVALARTVVVEPRVLLLDEPLSNLDANLRVQMRHEILELQRKLRLTTIFVTHDQEEANTTSDRMAVLDDGIIQQVGSPMDLYDRPGNVFVARFLGTANVIDGTIRTDNGHLVFQTENGNIIPVGTGADDARHLIFRPQNIEIVDRGTVHDDQYVTLDGTVGHMEFLGSIIRYTVDVGGDRLLVDAPHKQGIPVLAGGQDVSLFLKPDQIMLLAR